MESVTFTVAGSNSYYKLELAGTLIRFAEFDFTYFWEQCIEAGRNARKTGRISANMEAVAMAAAVKCHPYVEACQSTEFSSLVIDCIIAYICHSEGIGLEELWGRCISPKSMYERDIFNRVSEYKTGRGINQWINIVRMQEYVRSKMSFVYDTPSNSMLSSAEYRARREYFDLAFAVAANETGCDMRRMPSVRKYTPSTLPDCVFTMGRMSKSIYKRLSDVLKDAPIAANRHLNDHNRDSAALDAFSYVKDMPRPETIDMNFAIESVSSLPDTIYVPDCFKALIDLEFTCMQEQNVFIFKCPRCGKYFRRAADDSNPYCRRINSSGMTCTELVEEETGIELMKNRFSYFDNAADKNTQTSPDVGNGENTAAAEADDKRKSPEYAAAAENGIEGKNDIRPADNNTQDTDTPIERSDTPPERREIPLELEKRCQKVYNMLYKRVGKIMTQFEFKEWSKFLSDLKRDLREGNADISQVEDFLNYWETAVRKQSRRSKRKNEDRRSGEKHYGGISETDDTAENGGVSEGGTGHNAGGERADILPLSDASAALYDRAIRNMVENNKTEPPVSAASSSADAAPLTDSGISPAGTENSPEERVYKPFNPPKYNTVLEAMQDGKYTSEELLGGSDHSPDVSDIRVNGKKVRIPDWERINRE